MVSPEFVAADEQLVYHTLEPRDLSSIGCAAAGAYTHHRLHRDNIHADAGAAVGVLRLLRAIAWSYDAVDDIFREFRRWGQYVYESLEFGEVVPCEVR